MTSMPTPRWRYAFSSTLKGIYVMRYLLFSGGAAIAGAMLERAITRSDATPLTGLLAGALLGLLVFRGQFSAARGPILGLSREHLHIVRKRVATTVPWSVIDGVTLAEGLVSLKFSAPLQAPDGSFVEEIRLDARRFGVGAAPLHQELSALATDPAMRGALPPDRDVRLSLGLSG